MMHNRKTLSVMFLLTLFLFAAAAMVGCGGGNGGGGNGGGDNRAAEKELLNCDWTLTVKDQVIEDVEGLEFVYDLEISAVKKGGTDSMGEYTGTVHLTMNCDFSNLLEAGLPVQLTGGIDMEGKAEEVTFVVVPYNMEQLQNPEPSPGGPRIPPLAIIDYMSFGSFMITGMGSLDVLATDLWRGGSMGYSDTADATTPMGYSMIIEGATVYVYIDYVGAAFKGMVVGTPVK